MWWASSSPSNRSCHWIIQASNSGQQSPKVPSKERMQRIALRRKHWTCAKCTLVNDDVHNKCKACEEPKSGNGWPEGERLEPVHSARERMGLSAMHLCKPECPEVVLHMWDVETEARGQPEQTLALPQMYPGEQPTVDAL